VVPLVFNIKMYYFRKWSFLFLIIIQ